MGALAAVAVLLGLDGGCVLSRRQVMLEITTDADCMAFDTFQIRVGRGENNVSFERTFSRADCQATGITPPPPSPLRATMEGRFRIAIIDSQRTEDRLTVEVLARRNDSVQFIARASTDFVDDKVYLLPMQLARVCALNTMLACPSEFACRPNPMTGEAACGSVYRPPGTLGSFTEPQAVHLEVETSGQGTRGN